MDDQDYDDITAEVHAEAGLFALPRCSMSAFVGLICGVLPHACLGVPWFLCWIVGEVQQRIHRYPQQLAMRCYE